MALKDLLALSDARSSKRKIISEDILRDHLAELRSHIAFFREYPDYFIDFMKGEDSKFKLYTYQRIFLRIAMRHKYVYATFPRAFSKSFLSMLILMIRCILFPGSKLFVTTGGSFKNLISLYFKEELFNEQEKRPKQFLENNNRRTSILAWFSICRWECWLY